MYETKSRNNNNNIISNTILRTWFSLTKGHLINHIITKFNDHSDVSHEIYCHTPIGNLEQMHAVTYQDQTHMCLCYLQQKPSKKP